MTPRNDDSSQRLVHPLTDRPSRTREVFHAVREAIIRGELRAGELYSVADLADDFGVSRTPVREALIELASRGMVRFERNRGVRVVEWGLSDLLEIFELRIMIEVPLARKAAEAGDPEFIAALTDNVERTRAVAATAEQHEFWDLDREFHRMILQKAGNRRAEKYIETLRDLILLRDATTAGRSRSWDAILAEHVAILDAFRSGSPDEVATAMRHHLDQTLRLLAAQ